MEKSSFFNSVNGDRKYKAEDFASYFNSLITNGVFPNPSTNLQVLSNNNMTVTVKAGKAWINGYVYINDSDLILNVDVADGVLNRIDRIVLRIDTMGRNITAKVKKGTSASSPTAPSLQRDADAYELGIANIYVSKGAVSITQVSITDLRQDQNYCGIVSSLITPDTATLFNQFTAGFNDWFNSIKGMLDTDQAGSLLNQITNLAGAGRTTETVKKNADDLASHKADDMKHIDYAVASGTNTYTATITNITALTEGLSVKIKFTNANTGASTLNLNSLGAKTIQKGNGNALSSGNIKAGQICHLVYTGSVFQLLGEGGEYGTATSAEVLNGYTLGTDNGIVNGALTLTGTAGVGDVISGKTFYNTNAKTLLTGTATIQSLGGKRWASGTVTASSSTSNFTYINGSTNAFNYVTVTGLNFKPSTIYLKCLNVSVLTSFYDEISSNDLYSKPIKVCNAYNSASYTGITSYHIKGDVAPASIVTGSFTMPVIGNNLVYNWIAFE